MGFGGNSDYGPQHRSRLQQDHGPRHGPWWQPDITMAPRSSIAYRHPCGFRWIQTIDFSMVPDSNPDLSCSRAMDPDVAHSGSGDLYPLGLRWQLRPPILTWPMVAVGLTGLKMAPCCSTDHNLKETCAKDVILQVGPTGSQCLPDSPCPKAQFFLFVCLFSE